jgi:hypothetical protein
MPFVQEQLGIFWSRILVEKVMVAVQDWVLFQVSLCGMWDMWLTEWCWDRFLSP